ncbi:MAG: phosphatase PAP2 family protein [bacterium]
MEDKNKTRPGRIRAVSAVLILTWIFFVPGAFASEHCNFFCTFGHDISHFVKSSATITTLMTGLSMGSMSTVFDQDITRSRINSDLTGNAKLDHFFEPGAIGGSTAFHVGTTITTVAVGQLLGSARVSNFGMQLVRAHLLNTMVTQLLKRTVRRERPDGSNRRSFPSGHASSTFALATVLQRNFGWKVGLVAYTFATYVGVSRLSENKHYLSDVIMGAAVGIATAQSIGRGPHNTVPVQPLIGLRSAGLRISVILP